MSYSTRSRTEAGGGFDRMSSVGSVASGGGFDDYTRDALFRLRKKEIGLRLSLSSRSRHSSRELDGEDDDQEVPMSRKIGKRFYDANKLGNFFELRPINNWELYLENEKTEFYQRLRINIERSATRKDFKFISTIGSGAFARVMIAKKKDTRLYYAIKIYDKKFLVHCNIINLVENERKALNAIRFPFMVNSEYFFQDFAYLFFALPLCLGGELGYHLLKFGSFTEYFAKFIAAQVILALEYLHFMNVIYRDLKPENIVIDHDGFIKITDFTTCKFLYGSYRTYTMCGTPEYVAPEMLTTSGYNKYVDLWQLGVFIFNLVAGITPFYHPEIVVIYKRILECNYKLPSHSSEVLKDLIKKLIQLIPDTRLGVSPNGFQDIKEHPWFENILWSALLNREVIPPFIPDVKDVHDTRYFYSYEDKPLRIEKRAMWYREFANFY